MHAQSGEKNDDSKDSFYEGLGQVFDNFPTYHIKILLRDFNKKKVRRENIFKPIIGNKNIHQDSNVNGVRRVNFATSQNLVVKSTMHQHRNICTPGPLLMGRLTIIWITY